MNLNKLDIFFYKKFNIDIRNLNNKNALNHYKNYGFNENRISNINEFYNLYPTFNINYYKKNNKDLKYIEDVYYLSHYHHYGKFENREITDINILTSNKQENYIDHLSKININEKRLFNINTFYDLYPDFNLTFYKNFNNKLIFNSDIDYLYHFHIIGNNDNINYFINDVDFTDEYFYNKLTNELTDKIYNGYYIRNIKNYDELFNYNKKFQKYFFIYNNLSFYKYYSDFDLNFYKNKYFFNSNKSDDDIMLYYHTHGKYNGEIINDKIKIIIYTQPFDFKCGGVVAMHYLAKIINEYNNKFYCKLFVHNNLKYNNIFCNNFARIDEINDSTIVIYPEIVSNNPLNCKNVIRWILLELGIEMPIDHYKNWSSNDIVYHWEPKDHSLNTLRHHYINPIFNNHNYNIRNDTCFLVKKGRLIHSDIKYFHQNNSRDIENLSLEEIANIFNKSKYFYTYDPKTMYIIYSLLCGCIPVIYPLKNMNKEEYLKTTIFYNNNQIYDKGIAYGNSLIEIEFATNTLNDGINDIKLLFKNEINYVYNFLNNLIIY